MPDPTHRRPDPADHLRRSLSADELLVLQFRNYLRGIINAFGSTFDADRRVWEDARRP